MRHLRMWSTILTPENTRALLKPILVGAILAFGRVSLRAEAPLLAADVTGVDEPVGFQVDILPLLSNKCFRCHGPDAETREAGLRLDEPQSAFAELDSGAIAIVPGDVDESELIRRIETDDDDLQMPPHGAGTKLTRPERELLKRWIRDGATYQRHWSFVPPQQPTIPVHADPWVRNSIDAFVLDRLHAVDLRPQPEADPYRLARRAALALIGLPPDWKRVERLTVAINASTQNLDGDRNGQAVHDEAYEDYVDALLADPAFGERWARVWLDLARYADSAGYAQDPPRSIWKYRDWVIDAVNNNMPFDEFTLEQLAGDLLPHATESQLVATGFHRNTMTNSEGGTDDEEFRSAAVVDRVNTTMQVWMGMTVGCAQCHDHKYDPISQEEYFQFYAILNNTQDADLGDESPTIRVLTQAEKRQRARLAKQIEQQQEVVRQSGELEWTMPTGPIRPRYLRIELPGDDRYLSLSEVQAFSQTQDKIDDADSGASAEDAERGVLREGSLSDTNLALGGKATQSTTAFSAVAERAIDGNTDGDFSTARSTTHTEEQADPWWEVDFGEPRRVDHITIWNRTDGDVGGRLAKFRVVLLDDQHRAIWVTERDKAPDPSMRFDVPVDATSIAKGDQKRLQDYLRDRTDSPERKRLAALRQEFESIRGETTPILRELPFDRRRETRVHIRGNFMNLGEKVTPSTPEAFPPIDSTEPNRLAMANWLVSQDNPLTARVVVNRYWEQIFGIGLVDTSEDFGRQGNLPSHPELLDHLAVGLMEHGWNTKWLLREIVTSATFRQSARVDLALIDRDPNNRLLARGPRFRLSAEMIRDQALTIAGLLSDKMHGPSVRPQRPNLGLRAAFGGSTDWETSQGEDRYRRGVYTSWRRTTPYPSMTTFDAPSREFCTVRRIRTNTPLQALVTLNDPVFVEAAQALARRIADEPASDASVLQRACYGIRLCLARPATDDEAEALASLFHQARQHFESRPEDAESLTMDPLGAYPGPTSITDLAAWTTVANVLLNLDELLSR